MSSKTIKYLLKRQMMVLWAAVAGVGAYLFLMTWGPYLETKYFPMERHHKIVRYEEHDDYVRIKMSYDKVRNCEYRGISWYSGTPFTEATRVRVVMNDIYADNTQTRLQGAQITGWWDVYLNEKAREKPMFGVTDYACGMPWTSHSVVGPFYKQWDTYTDQEKADAIQVTKDNS